VKKGDVLAEIDPVVYGAQVSQQQANLAAQRASIASAGASAKAARISSERTEKLFAQNLASKAELDTAKGELDIQMSRVATSEAQLGAIQAQLAQSRTNVSWTKIYSPVDGVVVNRAIDPGATVAASFQVSTLFVIAQDLRKMRVLADVDEADVGKLKEGMEAETVVDAFPGEIFKGVVQQIRFSPNNVSGVVTYSAVVEVDNGEEKLRPGMTATVTIKTRESKAVARIPNSALRYKPTSPKAPDGNPQHNAPPVAATPPLLKGRGRVFLLTSEKAGDEKIEPKVITIGATDGIFTEVTANAIPLGAKVVTDENDEEDKKKKAF
jgi:HlyD family secretion protein